MSVNTTLLAVVVNQNTKADNNTIPPTSQRITACTAAQRRVVGTFRRHRVGCGPAVGAG